MAISLTIYLLTLAPDLTWANFSGDGGELIAASYTLGIPHPPGYPTYTLLGKAFSLLPIRSVAWRYNLFSAVTMALAAALVTATVLSLLDQTTDQKQVRTKISGGKSCLAAVIAGLFFAFSPLVWQQAIVAEVYTLNALLVSLMLLVTLKTITDKSEHAPSHRRIFSIGLLFGLSLTTHLTSLLLFPLIIFSVSLHTVPTFLAGIATGLLPFLALPVFGRSGSPVIWGKPDSWSGWLWMVSGRLYRPNVFALPASEWGARLVQWGAVSTRNFSWLILPLVFLGVNRLRRRRERRLLVLMLVTVGLYGLYSFTYQTNDAIVFFLPGLLLLSIILGFGLGTRGWLGLSLLLFLVALNLPAQRLDATDSVRPPAEQLISEIPPEAVVLTPGDQTIATLWYFHHVEGMRPDLIIIDGNLFQFDWYREQIARAYPDLQHLAQDDLDGFRKQNRLLRPVCEISLVHPETNHCMFAN